MSKIHIAKDVFAFLMIGLLFMLASEETKVIDDSNELQQACVFPTPNLKPLKTNYASFTSRQIQQPSKCFVVNYPIQIQFPNATKKSISSLLELDEVIGTWFEENHVTDNEPTFIYPFNITMQNGRQLLIENEEQFLRIADACDEEILEDNYNSVNNFCFDFIYPIQLVDPYGKTQQVNSDDQVDKAIQKWRSQHPTITEELAIQFPINIKFDDGGIVKLEGVNGLSEAIQYCESDSLEYIEDESETPTPTPVIGA